MSTSHSMSARNKDCMIWAKQDEWSYVDNERNRIILTDKAPEEARRSFEKWKRINNLDWDD